MYTKISTRNYIEYVNFTIMIIRGNYKPQRVRNWFTKNAKNTRLNCILATAPREPIYCMYIMIFMTNVHAKNDLPWCCSYDTIEE